MIMARPVTGFFPQVGDVGTVDALGYFHPFAAAALRGHAIVEAQARGNVIVRLIGG